MAIVELHSLFWGIALVLFAVSYWRFPKGIVAGLLRADYLLVIGTGITMIVGYGFLPITLVKGVLAIALIGVMEMIITRRRQGKPTGKFWLMFALLLAVVLYVGIVLI
ncbi:MAG: DUF1516 family protein [Tumebacillaceae bacterium]